MEFNYPEDLKPYAQKVGNRWVGKFDLPWRRKQTVKDPKTKRIVKFDTEHEAKDAAAAVMCWHFRNKTTGWSGRGEHSHGRASAESQFKVITGGKKDD